MSDYHRRSSERTAECVNRPHVAFKESLESAAAVESADTPHGDTSTASHRYSMRKTHSVDGPERCHGGFYFLLNP